LTACQSIFVDTPTGQKAVVTSVTDGDTIEVGQASGGSVVVRLAGINAPEADECHFMQAREYLTDETLGATVVMETLGTDRFGRTLAHVFVRGIDINESLVALGHAIALTPDPETPNAGRLLRAEEEAAGSDRGLWADDACEATGPIPLVRISGYVVNPEGPDEQRLEQEVVVISNEGSSEIDISRWVLRDESSLHRHTFEPGTRLGPGETQTVTSASPSWEPGGGAVWNNDGDLILLKDATGRVVDAVRY
jgi:micrococcal nuclease